MQAWPQWSWLKLQLPQLFHSTVTKALDVTRIPIVVVTRIPAAVTKITLVSCCRDAGRIHSEAQWRLLCNPYDTHTYPDGVFLANLEGSEDQGFPFEVQQLTPLSWATTPPCLDCQSKNIIEVKAILVDEGQKDSFFNFRRTCFHEVKMALGLLPLTKFTSR